MILILYLLIISIWDCSGKTLLFLFLRLKKSLCREIFHFIDHLGLLKAKAGKIK